MRAFMGRVQMLGYIFLLSASCMVGANEIVVKAPNGENLIVNVQPEDTFLGVMQQLETIIDFSFEPNNEYRGIQKEYCIDYSMLGFGIMPAAATSIPRNYNTPVTPQEKKDLAFLVNTLAKASLVSLLRQKKDLEAAGARINQIHPLRFILAIFTDEELKVGIRNIRPRGWVWGDFIKGLRDSLSEENARGNLTDEQVRDFAARLEIDPKVIFPYVHAGRWDEFVDVLIQIVPRKGEPGRYDI